MAQVNVVYAVVRGETADFVRRVDAATKEMEKAISSALAAGVVGGDIGIFINAERVNVGADSEISLTEHKSLWPLVGACERKVRLVKEFDSFCRKNAGLTHYKGYDASLLGSAYIPSGYTCEMIGDKPVVACPVVHTSSGEEAFVPPLATSISHAKYFTMKAEAAAKAEQPRVAAKSWDYKKIA